MRSRLRHCFACQVAWCHFAAVVAVAPNERIADKAGLMRADNMDRDDIVLADERHDGARVANLLGPTTSEALHHAWWGHKFLSAAAGRLHSLVAAADNLYSMGHHTHLPLAVGVGSFLEFANATAGVPKANDKHSDSADVLNATMGANATSSDAARGLNQAKLATCIRFLVYLITVQSVAAIMFEVYHKRWAETNLDRELPRIDEQPHTAMHTLFTGLTDLCSPYFASEAGEKGRFYLATVTALSVSGLFVAFVHNLWQKEWWDVFQHREADRFVPLIGALVAIIIAATLAGVYQEYIKQMLLIHWRSFMTRRLYLLWLDKHNHFFMQIKRDNALMDNPDQRIQEDVGMFASSTLSLAFGWFESLGTLAVFGPVILYLEPTSPFGCRLPGWLLYFAVLWSAVGTVVTHVIGRNLIRLSFAQQRYEADFRRQAVHVQSNAESIVLYDAEGSEAEQLQSHFENIKVIFWQHMTYNKRLTFYTVAYSYVSVIIPFMILAPAFFKQEISLGDLFQLTGALGQVRGSLDWFINSYGPLTDWRATADRLLAFEDAIHATSLMRPSRQLLCSGSGKEEAAGQPDMEEHHEGSWLSLSVAEVSLPSGAVLWKDVCLQVQRGQKVLLSGPEGVGKSVLFKALAGVWPWVADCQIRWMQGEQQEVLFVPQRPALPKACSLRKTIAYPEAEDTYTDAEITAILQLVGLEVLLQDAMQEKEVDTVGDPLKAAVAAETREGCGLDRAADWSMRLSPGMQQRLAVGHVLLHKPRLLFLDEATSNVSKEAAVELYTLLMNHLPGDAAVISISHDVDTLRPFHDLHYTIEGEGEEKRLIAPGVAGTGEK
mmetsp:Transcript_43014/g.98871  ORF Transcript_43014/g.98871 Transcript_43014/m.98871 type:complete len:833 (-) Transcript_43014:13-2511(-)